VGEARRRQAREAQLAAKLLAVPDAERAAIADEVGAVVIRQPVGEGCFARNALGRRVIARRLGIVAPLVVGGLLYRAGPDDARDVIAFCGPDGRLALRPDGCLGHWWLQVGDLVLDFTPPDWVRESAGHVRFDVPPPPYVWTRRGSGIVLPSAPGSPPLGGAFYRREAPQPAAARVAVAEEDAELQAWLAARRGAAA
jgi:hypothetical protein